MMIVVRHACPAYGPDTVPEEWELSAEGEVAARSLTRVLPADALLVASAEPKARQTLEPTGPVHVDTRFNEVARKEPYEGDFRARRRAYVSGTDHPGWEARSEVVARFAAGITFWQVKAAERPLVVASHGMAMTLWLTQVIALSDPGDFWSQLWLPDPLVVDIAARTVTRIESPDLIRAR